MPQNFLDVSTKFFAMVEIAVPTYSFKGIYELFKKEILSDADKKKIQEYWKAAISLY